MSTVREIHEQGRVEGRVEATRGMLLRFLRGRFGPDALTAPIRDRIASATLDQLEAWADAVSHADSVDDVFGS